MKTFVGVIALCLCILPLGAYAEGGVLYMSPERAEVNIDDEFVVEVRADTGGEASFAAEADLAFNPQALSVQKISTDGSVLAQWPTPPEFSNTKGMVRFSGTAAKSFSGSESVLVRITFRAIGVAPGDIHFESGAILKNDARAMNIITSMRSALFTITAKQAAPAEAVPTAATSTPVETPEVKGASIQVPTISGYDDRVSIGERIILQGTASPDSSITVSLQHDDDAPIESEVLSARDGSFTYVSREKAERGIYRASASVKADSGRLISEKIIITVGNDGYAAAAESMGSMLVMALPYLVLLIVSGLSLGFFYNRRAARKVEIR